MNHIVTKLTNAETKLLKDCLCLAIEYETSGDGTGMSEKQAKLGRRIIDLSTKLKIDTGWNRNDVKGKKQIQYERQLKIKEINLRNKNGENK